VCCSSVLQCLYQDVYLHMNMICRVCVAVYVAVCVAVVCCSVVSGCAYTYEHDMLNVCCCDVLQCVLQ